MSSYVDGYHIYNRYTNDEILNEIKEKNFNVFKRFNLDKVYLVGHGVHTYTYGYKNQINTVVKITTNSSIAKLNHFLKTKGKLPRIAYPYRVRKIKNTGFFIIEQQRLYTVNMLRSLGKKPECYGRNDFNMDQLEEVTSGISNTLYSLGIRGNLNIHESDIFGTNNLLWDRRAKLNVFDFGFLSVKEGPSINDIPVLY